MSVTFAASDQTAELEKSNENLEAQDVSMAIERPDRSVELEEEDENGDVQHLGCFYTYRVCLHRFGYICYGACLFQLRRCKNLPRKQDVEGSIQDTLAAPDQRPEFEEESEKKDIQRLHPILCIRTYRICVYYFRHCTLACDFHYFWCIRGRLAADAEESIQQEFATLDQRKAIIERR